jgi:hypothetical protein
MIACTRLVDKELPAFALLVKNEGSYENQDLEANNAFALHWIYDVDMKDFTPMG